MLAYILAMLVGTGSVGLYVAAFFFPEIHRKNDFIWSGVGFFYALFLWIYARQITGGVLVGQTASIALIGWFAWQTVKLRRQIVPANQQTPLPSKEQIQSQLRLKPTPAKTPAPKGKISPPPPPKKPIAVPPPPPETQIELEVIPPAPLENQPLGTPLQPPTSNPSPRAAATRSVPSQPDMPLPPPRVPIEDGGIDDEPPEKSQGLGTDLELG